MTAPRVYLDSNVFVAAFEHAGAHSDHAWWILQAIEEGAITGATSELTLAELLVKPIEQGAADLAAAYDDMIVTGPHFETAAVSRHILKAAASVRAQRASVRLPDAIHIATAEALHCRFLVSEDRRLSLPEGMQLISLSPFALDDILAEGQ